jgi:release factor glutamine methyltransferase
MTVAELLAEAAQELRTAQVSAPEWDAERLVRHVLAWDRATLVARGDTRLAPEDEERVRHLVAERARRRPLQHLLGSQAFWKHEFQVSPDVLVPRLETELLVETALELVHGRERPLIVDVGTGSGCIALSLAFEREDARVHAIDVSGSALRVARENARRLRLEDRVGFHHGDLLAPVEALAGEIDLVVSNPPYVDPEERDALAPEVRDHEPHVALFPPGDALSVYRRLAPAAAAALRPGGALALEVSPFGAEAVAGLLASSGFGHPVVRCDLAGLARVVHARRHLGAGPPVG